MHSHVHSQTTNSQVHGQTTAPTERARPASTSVMPQSVRPHGMNKESLGTVHQKNVRPIGAETSVSTMPPNVRPQAARKESAKDTSAERARPPLSVFVSQNTHSRSADGKERMVLRGAAVQKAVRNSAAESRPQADHLDRGRRKYSNRE